jgi:hypothetical protein
MKKSLITFLIVLFAVVPLTFAKDFNFTFAWNANTEPDMAGYAIFQREGSNPYDYTKPIDPDCTIVNGGCYTDPTNLKNEFTLPVPVTVNIPAVTDFTAVFNKVTNTIDFSWSYTVPSPVTYSWVARARDNYGNWSADSNEVSKTFDLGVTHWALYQGTASGGPYTQILDIPWDGTSALAGSLEAGILAPGTTYYFTIVGFTADGIFSPDSNEVQIDRRPPTKVINLRITLVE